MRGDGFARLVTASDEKVVRDLLDSDPVLARRLREVAMAQSHALSVITTATGRAARPR